MIAQRRRILTILGSTALVFAAAAAFALYQRAAEGLPRHTPEIFLPGFAESAPRAARIEIIGPSGAFAVVQTPQGWVLPDRGNYPADFDEVRRTLISLAQLTTIAPKTQRPDWLTHLALATPPKGNGTQITVKDAQGAVLAQLITGNTEELGDPSGAPPDGGGDLLPGAVRGVPPGVHLRAAGERVHRPDPRSASLSRA